MNTLWLTQHWKRLTIAVILFVALAVSIGLGLAARQESVDRTLPQQLASQSSVAKETLASEETLESASAESEPFAETPATSTEDVPLGQSTTTPATSGTTAAPRPPIAPEDLHIMLIGSDAREGVAGQRSDTMMLLSYDSANGSIKLTSFMRDTWVKIDGQGYNKLNAAFAKGGDSLVEKTLENNFELDIDHYVTVRFEQFIAIVDQIGGIPLDLSAKEIEYINVEIADNRLDTTPGVKVLTGAQALSHCRNRRVGNGDFTRTARQRATVLAILQKLRQQRDPAGIVQLVSFATSHATTDLGAADWLPLAKGVLEASSVDFQQARIPFDDTWHYATEAGQSVISIDLEANRSRLRSFLES
jgi:LCP family protein required for cell wall assembly